MSFFTLLPNARTQLSAVAKPPAAGGTRRQLVFGVEIRADNAAVPGEPRLPVGAELLSAGDVIGVDGRMISRVDPPSGATGFEPNYLPFVEFADADFPWRYSYEAAGGPRIRPWIVLLALKPSEFEFLNQGDAPSPRIRVANPAASLPNLSQSWAFAHVHVGRGDALSPDLAGLIATRPDRHHARLMCLRRLEPNTAYTLMLVPATEASRLAGLGVGGPVEPFDKPAWDASTAGGLELPIYFQSRFVTSVLEDFEILARRLKPFVIEPDSTIALPQVAFAGAPGFYPDYSNADATFEVQDALMRADRSVEPFNTDPELTTRLEPTLAAVIAGDEVAPGDDGPDREDPLVAMPPYGWRFLRQKSVAAAAAAAGAFVDRVNLDLKFRHAAGLGAETVRRHQERFARICWSQYRDVVAANQALARLKTARELTRVVSRRHVAPLPPDIVASLSETVHDLARMPSGVSPSGVLAQAGVPRSFTSRALRRVSSKRTLRRGGAGGRPGRVVAPMPRVPGAAALTGLPRRDVVALPVDARQRIVTLFGEETVLRGTLPPRRAVVVNPVRLEALATSVSTFFVGLSNEKAKHLIGGLAPVESEKLDSIMRAPVVSDPLVDALNVVDGRAILRGIDTLPNNTVTMLKENRLMVEAFLVGANHEMNNELRWREFPTDMRGTIFRRFWDRKRPPDDPTGNDIPEIHRWTAPLGRNYPAHDADRTESLVLLIRGDLIRKYGMILCLLNRANATAFVRGQGTDYAPIFAGRLGADACYFGFDVARDTVLAEKSRHFFVLFEAPGRVRFGLDAASAAVRRDRFDFQRAPLAFPVRALGRDASKPLLPAHLRTGHPPPVQATTWDDLSWTHMQLDAAGYLDVVASSPGVAEPPNYWSSDRDSATIARSVWQKPIAAVVPATRLLP
jgi:hypothetical protein